MIHARPSLALIPLAAFAVAPTVGEVAFHPEEGSTLTKTFTVTTDMELEDLSAVVDGQDVGAMMGSMEVNVSFEMLARVTDTYHALAEARPSKLERSFDELQSNIVFDVSTDFGGEEQEMPLSSELEGTTVVFTWSEEDGEYEVAFADDEGDDELLEGLEEDMDLRALLPSSEVEVDDTWTVSLEDLTSLAGPGGALKFDSDELSDEDFDSAMFEEMFAERFEQMFMEGFDGSCVCTYKGEREEDGAKLAEIDVELQVAGAVDMSEMIVEVIETMAAEQGEDVPPIDIEVADLNIDVEGTGTLFWNTAEGRVQSLNMSNDLIMGIDLALGIDADGESHSAEVSAEMSGSYRYQVEASE